MKKRFDSCFLEGVCILTGTIIGAGVLAIPYALMKAGFLTGLINLFVLSTATILLYLYLGEVILRTKKKHQLTGYAQEYLGNKGRRLMAFSMVFGNYGALIAYLIGVGRSLSILSGTQNNVLNLLGISLSFNFIFSLLFFVLGSAIVYLGIKGVGRSELFMDGIIIFVVIFISIIAIFGLHIDNLVSFNVSKIFLPYGVILFALAGAVAIPEVNEELENKKSLRKAILIGSLIPIFIYFLFSFAVVGACGKETTEIATNCLSNKFGGFIMVLGNLFAILAMATSFFTIGLGLKEMYNYDYRIKEKKAWFLACFIPLILFIIIFFFLKEEIFFKTIGITGGIAMTLEGILIVWMFNRAKKLGERKPEYSIKENKFISILLIVIFLMGMIYTILDFFKVI